MGSWILVTILTVGGVATILDQSRHDTVAECFNNRDLVILKHGRPIVNYQAVCIKTVSDDELIRVKEDRSNDV